MRHLVIIFLLSSYLINGQGGFRSKSTPCPFFNGAKAVFETTPNNYIAGSIGIDTLGSFSTNRLVIMGLGPQGQPLWTKKYGDHKFEYLDNVFITRSFFKQGNYIYYTGCVRDSNNKQIGVLIKFDLNGDTIWQKKFYDTNNYVIPQITTSSVDGGLIITGMFEDPVNINRTALVIKTDVNGNELWRKKITKAAPNVSDGKAIVQDSVSKKIVIVGYQYIGNASNWSVNDNVLILDSLGNKLSQHNYAGGGYGGWSVDLIQTKDKKFVVVGRAIYPQTVGGNNLSKSFIAKFDINSPATPIWRINNFDQLQITNFFHCVRELHNGDLLVAGVIDTMQLHNQATQNLQRYTIISPNGIVKWNRYYNYSNNQNTDNNQWPVSLELTSDKGWIVSITSNNIGVDPAFYVKYDSTGCDSTEIYCQALGVGIEEKKLNDGSFDLYPNPANESVTLLINEDLCSSERLQIKIVNALGQIVKTGEVVLENKKITINTRDLPNGFYIITLQTRSKSSRELDVSKRFIISK